MSLSSGRADSDFLSDIGYPVYRRLFDSEGDFVRELDETLSKARMPVPAGLYISRGIAIGLFVGFLFWLVGLGLGYGLFFTGIVDVGPLLGMPISNPALLNVIEATRVPALVLVTGLFFGFFGFTVGFGGYIAVPYFTVSSRRREINMLLPDAVSFMYALSIGGMNQLEIIEAIARAEDTYGEVAREFQTIVQETEYFDTDYRTAIREQSLTTPSDELSQFLTDMLSILSSGGNMTDFLDDKKDKHMRTAKQQQEQTLETLELFGEMYMTLSLFPLLLIIVLVIMSMLGEADDTLLFGTVYGLIPMIGAGFLVLVSTVKQDEIGDGYLERPNERQRERGVFSFGVVEAFTGEYSVFSRIRVREGLGKVKAFLRRPHRFFRDHPLSTLAVTVPAAMGILGYAVLNGTAPLSWSGMQQNPVWGTFVYVYLPLYVILTPLTVFHEWNLRSRRAVISNLSEDLRKLSSANDTGLTLLESIKTVADTSTGTLAKELDTVYAKVQYGTSLKAALIEFNNEYHIPRLARTVKLITKAQEASSQITSVLTTAAQASENRDDLERERKSRTRMQVVIILMTYLTLLAVMAILKTQFLDVMGGLSSASSGSGGGAASSGAPSSFGGNIDTALMNTLFFHAVTIQAVMSGLISGYIRNADLKSGLKFAIALLTVALGTWMVVG